MFALPAQQDPEITPITVVVSPTRLQAFSRCPRQYAESQHIPYDPSPAQQRGTYIHELVRAYNQSLLRGANPDVEHLLAKTLLRPASRQMAPTSKPYSASCVKR